MSRELNTKTRLLNKIRGFLIGSDLEKTLRNIVSGKSPKNLFSKLVPNHYQYPKESIRTIDYKGIKLSVDLSDYIGHYLYFNFKDHGQAKLIDLASKGDHVLDIGTNIGSTALLFADKVGPNGSVVGFEPDATNYKNCLHNLSLNTYDSLAVYNMALGDENTHLNMVVNSASNRGGNRISLDQSERGELVEVKKLDDFMKELAWDKLDLVKIDVEGYELKVLMGGVNTIKKNRPVLFIELDNNNLMKVGDSAKQLIDFLIFELNYTKFYHAESNEVVSQYDKFENCHFDIIAEA